MQLSQGNLSQHSLADSAGLFVSVACAIHCAAMPLAVGYLPLLGLTWLADEAFHRFIVLICLGLAAWAFALGWKKHHSLVPATFGLAGITLLSVAAFCLEGECCPSSTSSAQALHANVTCSDDAGVSCGAERVMAETPVSGATHLGSPTPSLLTLLGGLLLGLGHVINRGKSCKCTGERCCLLPQEKKEKAIGQVRFRH